MAVADRLGSAPIGHGVEQMDDPVAKLHDSDNECTASRDPVSGEKPTPLASELAGEESFCKPSHLLSLSGCDGNGAKFRAHDSKIFMW